jgi:CRP-like cAMP-binding protein
VEQEFVKSGTVVMEQGSLGNKAYIIKSGTVEVWAKDEDGNRVFLAELGPGSIIGEMATMCGGTRRATVTAKEDLMLTSIPERDLLDVSGASKKVYNYLAKLILLRKEDTMRKVGSQKAEPSIN